MPNSYAYNGTCIYFSSLEQKLSWIQAVKFCSKFPLNTTILIVQNEQHFEFIRRKLIEIKEKENPIDQLAFMVGFYKAKGF